MASSSNRRITEALRPWGAYAVLVGLLAVGFGIQSHLYQRDQDAQMACMETWGQQVTDALTTRVAAAGPVAAAEEERDEATRVLVEVLSRLATRPPEAVQSDLLNARVQLEVSAQKVQRAQQRLDKTRADNPYPTVACR